MRLDKSQAKTIDKPIRNLVKLINKNQDLCTTSSCSGRVVVIENPQDKQNSKWLYKTHDVIQALKIWDAMQEAQGIAWLLFEDIILHVICRDMQCASEWLKRIRDAGFKHSGIISIGRNPVIEIIGNLRLELPVADNNGPLIDKIYLKFLVNVCRKKMLLKKDKIKKLESVFVLHNH